MDHRATMASTSELVLSDDEKAKMQQFLETHGLQELEAIFDEAAKTEEEDETEVGESDGYEDEVDFEERRRRGFSEDQVTVGSVRNSLC